MKRTTNLILLAAWCGMICSCNIRPRPRIPEIQSELQSELELQSVSAGSGGGGTRNDDSIQSDHEDSVWIIPKSESHPDRVFGKIKDSISTHLRKKGADIVSSNDGASHGYAPEFLNLGGKISSHTFVYRFKGGMGFVDVFQATYRAEEETGRIGFNHIFIPYPK